jgi:hypothetical protein
MRSPIQERRWQRIDWIKGAWRLAATNLWLTTASEGQGPLGGTRRPTKPFFTAVATEDKEKVKKVRLFFAH